MLPSSSIISQITALSPLPASDANSTEASVCPCLTDTPPFLACRGKIWPGEEKSWIVLVEDAASLIVYALSYAEIPVSMPFFASIDIIKARSMRTLVLLNHR